MRPKRRLPHGRGPTRITPAVAPYQSCISCYRGDTLTAVILRGEAEFVIVGIARLCGLPLEQAEWTFDLIAREFYGCDPGKVPVGELMLPFRLCRECAERTGAKIAPLAALERGEPVMVYRDRGLWRDGDE